MTESRKSDDAVAERLERLRRATAAVGAEPDFIARVIAAAALAPPRPALDPVRAWWSVPVAAMLAAAALVWALRAHADRERQRASDDVAAALGAPAGAPPW